MAVQALTLRADNRCRRDLSANTGELSLTRTVGSEVSDDAVDEERGPDRQCGDKAEDEAGPQHLFAHQWMDTGSRGAQGHEAQIGGCEESNSSHYFHIV